jgi:hypothetical protein
MNGEGNGRKIGDYSDISPNCKAVQAKAKDNSVRQVATKKGSTKKSDEKDQPLLKRLLSLTKLWRVFSKNLKGRQVHHIFHENW